MSKVCYSFGFVDRDSGKNDVQQRRLGAMPVAKTTSYAIVVQ